MHNNGIILSINGNIYGEIWVKMNKWKHVYANVDGQYFIYNDGLYMYIWLDNGHVLGFNVENGSIHSVMVMQMKN